MTETRHPSPISTCSRFRPCSPRLLLAVPTWILATSCQSRGCCHGNQKRHLRRPKAVWLAMSPPVHHNLVLLGWPWPVKHHSHFPSPCLKASSLRGQAQGWVLAHLHGAGVSELASTGGLCHQDSKESSASSTHSGGVRTGLLRERSISPALGSQEGPPGLCPNVQAGTQVAVMSLPTWEMPDDAKGARAGRLGGLGLLLATSGQQSTLATTFTHRPLSWEETVGPSRCLHARKCD